MREISTAYMWVQGRENANAGRTHNVYDNNKKRYLINKYGLLVGRFFNY